ncbi:MAG TPA: DnaJ domain-containing protein [Myxococcaceae bacterium]|nr:DnaJ domain-containing protein [Myxococcaceae bacterium]
MPDADAPRQVFIRTERGLRWGPLTPAVLELLVDNGHLEGRFQISLDGEHFDWPGQFPEIRDFLPRALWGDGAMVQASLVPAIAPLDPTPADAAPVAPIVAASPSAPLAGPGTRAPLAASPGPGAPPIVRPGPGALQNTVPPRLEPVTPPSAPIPTLQGVPEIPTLDLPPLERQPIIAGSLEVTALEAAPTGDAPPGSPAAGDLSSISPVRLYYLAAYSDATALLTLWLADRVVEIHFRKGNPEYVGSSHPEDAVAGFLMRQGLATVGQIAQAEGAVDRFGGDLVAALFGLGILNPATAFAHLAQRAQALLFRALVATSGRFQWTAKELPPHRALPLGNRWGVLMEVVRRVPGPEVRQRLGAVLDNPLMKSGGHVSLSDLRLTPQETRAVGYIDGVRSLALLAHEMPQDAETFFRLAWVLGEMDAVSFAAAKLAPPPSEPPPQPAPPQPAAPAQAPAPPVSPPARAAPSVARAPDPKPQAPRPAAPAAPKAAPPAPPSGPIDFAAELRALRDLDARIKSQNYFQLLGLDEKADATAVKVAYFKLAKQHHPDTVPPGAPPELAQLKVEIFATVGAAYRTLSEESSRQRYLAELQHGAGEVDVAALLRADDLFQRGCVLVKAKRFAEAVEVISQAIALNPEEGEFYAWRGVGRFFAMADPKQGRAEAERDLAMAITKNPNCAQAYYFYGQLAKLLGDKAGAAKHFRKVLEIQPEHVEAQREMRLLQKKK